MNQNLIENSPEEINNDNIILTSPMDNNINGSLNTNASSTSSNDFSDFSDPRKIFYIIILGEIIAILSVSSGEISNKIYNNNKRDYGTVLCFIYYLTFGLFWFIFNHGMTKPKYYYFLILFFDTQTNFFKILSLTEGDLSYPYVINSSSILFIALLTYFFIKKYKYTWKHFLATFLCISGTILAFYGVLKGKDIQEEIEKNLNCFIFSLISAICFTLTIIFMEIHFKNGKDIYLFFPYLGVFGTLIVFIESIIYFEINNLVLLQNFSIDLKHIFFVLLFVLISLAIGTMVPFYIKRYSASIYNFFMVSQIFWSYIFKLIFDKKTEVSFHFYIGFSIILGSTILFSIFKLKKIMKKTDKNVNLQNMNINLVSSSERSTQL